MNVSDKSPPRHESQRRELLPTTRQIQNLNILSLEKRTIPLWHLARHAHYRKNAHLLQLYTNPKQMDELNRKHLLCDLLACFLGSQSKHGPVPSWTIPQAANICKAWPDWKYVQDVYTGSYEKTSFTFYQRWRPNTRYTDEKNPFKVFLKSFLFKDKSIQDFITGLYSFRSVQDFLEDLRWHQQTIVEVGKELFPDDAALHATLATHDDDKWDAWMIAAYVWKWIHGEDEIVYDEKFLGICSGCLVARIVEDGKEVLKTLSKDEKKGYLFALQKNNK